MAGYSTAQTFKWTVSQDFRPFFSLKDSTWAPYEQATTVFCKLFRFREDIRLQSLKIVFLRSQQRGGHANFSLDTDIFIYLNYCYCVLNTPKYLFSPDCSFKICEKPSTFSDSVCVVVSSLVCVRVVVDYADTMST